MMGVWHSDALKDYDCCLHTLVGRRAEPTAEFAARYGYRKWTISLDEALADPEIDLVILANPTELHARTALQSIAAGKHTLVEIPLAMSLPDAQRIVDAARERGVKLGVVHPMRMRPEMAALHERIRAGEEQVRHFGGRFFIYRLENVGATGYRRSWTDNLLWHHITHILDLGLWLLDQPAERVQGYMPDLDSRTGTPMEVFIGLNTAKGQSLVCTGSYYCRERIFDVLIVTGRDSYRRDILHNTLTTGAGTQSTEPEAAACGRVAQDFVRAVRDDREPAIPGHSVLPAMAVLQQVQDEWDRVHGAQSIPGRPSPSFR